MASLASGKVEKMWISDGVGQHQIAENKRMIICPWHNFEFDLETGLSPGGPDRLRIATYRVSLESDEVVIYL